MLVCGAIVLNVGCMQHEGGIERGSEKIEASIELPLQ